MTIAIEKSGAGSSQFNLYRALPYFLLFIGTIIVTILSVILFGNPSRWMGHAVTAAIGLVLLILVILTGAIQNGRIPFLHMPKIMVVHKISGTCFSGVVIGTFILGLLVILGHGEPILTSSHGILGLIVAILSGIQLVLSLVVTKRQKIRTAHKIIGYLIVPLFLLQIYLGISAAELIESHFH